MSDLDFDVLVVGSGFGGSVTALRLTEKGYRVGVLEAGARFEDADLPTTSWDLKKYLFRPEAGCYGIQRVDALKDCMIVSGAGVGGGSLVYANVTIRPPEFVLTGADWPMSWDKAARDHYYDLARDAIGIGVLWALNDRETKQNPAFQPAVPGPQVNTGLSNVATRSARLDPRWVVKPDPDNAARGVKQIDRAHSAPTATPPDMDNNLWIDRARVFQSAMGLPAPDGSPALTTSFGTVDSSINDVNPEPGPFDPKGQPKNYCERQGRCIVGCLPGARHTLNKQLMGAALGAPPSKIAPSGTPPLLGDTMELQALAEVDVIKASPGGGPPYEIHYRQRRRDDPTKFDRRVVTADRVIVAAGCVGTNEILLRSRKDGLPHLSDMVGYGFSTNGDYLGFLDRTRERVSLTRGPVTTSFAHFNADGGDPAKFHTIEDNGFPRAFSSLIGAGLPLFKSLSKGRHTRLFIWWALLLYALKRIPAFVKALFTNAEQRADVFLSEDERTMNIMCVAAIGRAAADARFRLGGFGETTLRVKRKDGAKFLEDPIYREIDATLDRFAQRLTDDRENRFVNVFVGRVADAFNAKSIGLSHPLGGCRMGRSAADGVCDEFGRVFDASKDGGSGVYEGLYIADAARIPTALGVNPSLTISALALYTVQRIIDELP